MTPDLAHAVKGRRKNLKKIWSSKEWKEKRAAFVAGKSCEMCGAKAGDLNKHGNPKHLLPHHPYKTSYKSGYTDLELSQCIVLCNSCHKAIDNPYCAGGICPVCNINYRPLFTEICKKCNDIIHPEIVAAREKFCQDRKDLQKKLRKEQAVKARKWKAEHGRYREPEEIEAMR